MLVRAILPKWVYNKFPERSHVIEGMFSDEQLKALNDQFYNIHYLPNPPVEYSPNKTVSGSDITRFQYVFVDIDMKDRNYDSKEAAVEFIFGFELPPTRVIDSGNGIHAYWKVSDLDAMSYLRLCRRLMRKFKSDEAVGQIFQLMRPPGFYNTKEEGNFKLCQELYLDEEAIYTCEQLDAVLPTISQSDEEHCQRHYQVTYNPGVAGPVKDKLPAKFGALMRNSEEVRQLYRGGSGDRSKSDFRLAHLLLAENFTRDEAMSVLVNVPKALERSSHHRVGYAEGIVNKIWTEEEVSEDSPPLSSSVMDILKRGTAIQGTRIECSKLFDDTEYGFRLTHVLGLIGGAGSGKTTLTLNYFYHFVKLNPDYIHLFVSLEQPEEEIAMRWAKVCKDNEGLHDKVHVLGNYDADGTYRNLSLAEIETYIQVLEKRTGQKVGCVVIDHVGVLKKKGKEGEAQGLIDIFHHMKAFAKKTNTFLVMQSQTSREKAGLGDLELDKDAAYGSSMFEWYCDYIVTTWQPLKRVYTGAPHMLSSAFKYCKIRHKNSIKDRIKEDEMYVLMFDPETEQFREMTQEEDVAYNFFCAQATILRNKDRKREPKKPTKIVYKGSMS